MTQLPLTASPSINVFLLHKRKRSIPKRTI
jgi:hypothetical protein